eukprot:815244_1
MCCLSFEGPQWIVTQCHIFREILSSTKHCLQQEAQISIPDAHADLTIQKPAASAEKPAASAEKPAASAEYRLHRTLTQRINWNFRRFHTTCFILTTAVRLNHGGTTLFSG